ncbi:metallophosphoesterase [Virgibacillus alimentarius]|uniref:metallophosphoesterase n=1 Tax=Virgibacillus alimentarius TaxID=698769 RepID=UPI0004937FC9|nr:metallophosphoesterase [Virgibacillus alimentarius]
MTKVLILSDSHGLTEEIERITDRHQSEYMIHCGDSELDMDAPSLKPLIKVGGNCDSDTRFPSEQVIQIENLTFLITHGHLHHVKRNLMTLSYRAEEVNAQIVCYGHTHIAAAQKFDNQLFINPGSIRLPKARHEKTYAVLEWIDLDRIKVEFYTVDGNIIKELSYQTTIDEK